MGNLRPHQSALLLAMGVTLVAWMIPLAGQVLLPLQYLNTHLHEFCHAIVAICTGGQVEGISVFRDGSGVTPVAGGWLLFVASAGYVGAAVGGAMVILFSRHEPGARLTLRILALLLLASMVLWVRHDAWGVISGIFWIVALAGLSVLNGKALLFAAQFIGVQQCLSSFQSLFTLLKISAVGEGQSDATLMANATHIPALIWTLLWCGLSLALVTAGLRRAWRAPIHPAESQ